ncbi:MAG TPA: PAS domain S-box protein [Candidatus Eisenbacteria bacterium]|nr:PAS domain S-box protein [Candidatus Eisenbacteria bacterium]
MLPSGKFPRFALFAALSAALLLFYDLEFVRNAFTRLLLSNSLDDLVLILAAFCSYYVAFRSTGFARQAWLLLAIALTIEAVGMSLSTYYQSFVPGSSLSAEPSDIFFFIWAAPIIMILLPQSDEQFPGLDPLRVLDFLQIAIVAVTAYLYFFYFTSRWKSDQDALVRGILLIYIFRDLLIGSALFFRSRNPVPRWFRSFSRVLGIALIACVAANTIYLVTLAAATGNASWGDLVWMLPYLFIIGLAVFWKYDAPASLPATPTRVDRFLNTQFFPILMPLLVIFMARAIARNHVPLAWLTVTASVLCSSIRLILTNRRQRRISDNLLSTRQALHRSEHMFFTAFRSSPDGFAITIFPDGTYLEVNDGFTALTGFTREDALHKSPLELDLWVDPAERERLLRLLRENGETRDFEFQFRTKAGNIRTGLLSGSLITLDGRQCFLVAVRDITDSKAAQEIIRSSEERFRTLVNDLHVGIVTCDVQGRVLFANQAVLNLVGLPKDQLIGRNVYDLGLTAVREDGTLIPDSDRPVSTVIRTGKPLLNQLVGYRHNDGPDLAWTILDVVPQLASSGELLGILVSLTDVTGQRHATEALRQSEERFRSFVEHLHVGVVSCNERAEILYGNPAALHMFGLKLDEVLGKTPLGLNLEPLREDGSVLPDAEGLVPTVIATRRPIHNRVIGWRRIHSTEVLWTLIDVVPQTSASGEVAAILVSLTNLTEQRRAIEALRESEERFRTLVRDLHVGVVLHNPDGTLQFANQAAYAMFGFTSEEALGRTPIQLGLTPLDVNGRVIPTENLPASTVIRTKLPVRNIVMGWRLRDREDIIWIFGNAIPQFGPDGSILRIITSFSDITEMKNAERSIHQLSTELLKLQDEERRRIGRELHDGMAQTVLAVNLSLAQLRQSGQPLTDASKAALDKARELLQQMSREIRTLSYLLHPPLLDDLGLVTALKEYANGFSERSGIETNLILPPRFRRLPQMVETAFFRITQESLANIQRHSGSKRARVCLREEPDSVVLEITDFGRGIGAPRNGDTPRPARLGVGIPGMRERMAQLGGDLEIDSDSTGTTVRARILLSAPALKDTFYESPSPSHRG